MINDITKQVIKEKINFAYGVHSKYYDSESLKYIRERVYTIVLTERKPHYSIYRDTDSLHEVQNGEK